MRLARTWTFLPLLSAMLISVFASGAAAQNDATPEQIPPETLLDALDLPVCAAFKRAEAVAPDDEAVVIVPDGADGQTVLAFDLSALDDADLLALIRFESKQAVAAKAGTLPLHTLQALAEAEPAAPSLYGWLVIYYDADRAPLCRTTAYPAIGGAGEPLTRVSFQGFIAQMVSAAPLDARRYQADAFCSFDTPQYCEAIFMGDDTDERITGSEGSDLISGAGGSDTIDGRAGDDVIDGGSGDDSIIGGDGDDVIYGGDGDDVIIAGSGDDVVRGEAGNDSLEGGEGLDTLDGGEGVDTVHP